MDRSFRELLVRLDRIPGVSADVRQKFRLAVSIVDQDVEMAATRARTILEHVTYTIHNKRSKNPFKGTLEGLLTQIISEGAFPKRLEGCAQLVKSYGNVGAHGTDRIKPADVARSLDAVLEILEWFAQEHPSERGDSAVEDSAVLIPPRTVRQSGQFRVVQTAPAAARTSVQPPPIRSSPAQSGAQKVVNLLQEKPGVSGALAMNILWGVLGALACAAVMANVGEVTGACIYTLGTEDMGGITKNQGDPSDAMHMAALALAFIGAISGGVIAPLASARWPKHAEATRGILAGALVGFLLLGLCGGLGFPVFGSAYGNAMTSALVGSMVGISALALGAFASSRTLPRGVPGAAAGAFVLSTESFFLFQSWSPAALFFGALCGALSQTVGEFAARGSRAARGLWLLVAVAVWSGFEAASGNRFELATLAVITLIGAAAGTVIHASVNNGLPSTIR